MSNVYLIFIKKIEYASNMLYKLNIYIRYFELLH